ncbi:MAG: HPr family phosphocarrier protein [Oscillospiraceae bacterium]|nr:HPr family phosphocarrier protein [Oscillospiraceae bacterium]
MIEKNITIANESGLHARPASEFVRFIKPFDAKISLVKGEKTVNAKSILHVLSLSLKQGDICTVQVDGTQEEEVLEKIETFLAELKD